jgi:hypothetical protein
MNEAPRFPVTNSEIDEALRAWGWVPPALKTPPKPRRLDRVLIAAEVAAQLGVSR